MIHIRFVTFLFFLTRSSASSEGDVCTVQDTGASGTCISVHECEDAKKLLQSQKIPQHCGFSNQTPLVCCPPNQEPTPGVKSEERCKQYHNVRNNLDMLIVSLSEKAVPREFQHMVTIGYGNGNKITWLCGGSLISQQFILTAAHCAKSKDFGTAKWIRLGDLVLNNTTEDAKFQDIRISQIVAHPDYKPPSLYHDIALMKLEKVVIFGDYLQPACLHTKKDLPGGKLQAIGWGSSDYFGGPSSHLVKVDLNVIEHETCVKRFSNLALKLDEFQICAGGSSGNDTCPGDSGGPLQFSEEDRVVKLHFVVVGVTSFGRGCGFENSAGVYTRVSSYVGWIENIVWA